MNKRKLTLAIYSLPSGERKRIMHFQQPTMFTARWWDWIVSVLLINLDNSFLEYQFIQKICDHYTFHMSPKQFMPLILLTISISTSKQCMLYWMYVEFESRCAYYQTIAHNDAKKATSLYCPNPIIFVLLCHFR